MKSTQDPLTGYHQEEYDPNSIRRSPEEAAHIENLMLLVCVGFVVVLILMTKGPSTFKRKSELEREKREREEFESWVADPERKRVAEAGKAAQAYLDAQAIQNTRGEEDDDDDDDDSGEVVSLCDR